MVPVAHVGQREHAQDVTPGKRSSGGFEGTRSTTGHLLVDAPREPMATSSFVCPPTGPLLDGQGRPAGSRLPGGLGVDFRRRFDLDGAVVDPPRSQDIM